MKNLKKLATSDLKKINGGNAPNCEGGYIACRNKAQNGSPAYWSCEPPETGCRF
ncbi:bacteriocin-like protein [Chryseobacterium lactis]|uniref:bacteriocin-like protein n=1 Tax=Chryseobacterium lactis TaxID=1241981 RepID=UPI0038B3CD33